MANAKVASAALTAGVVTMWAAASAEAQFVDEQIQVDVSGTYDPQSQIDDALLLIWSYSYDGSEMRYDVRFQSLGVLDEPGEFSYSGIFDIGIPIDYTAPNRVYVAILGNHASDTDDGVTVGVETYRANYLLDPPAWNPSTFTNVFFTGSTDPRRSQGAIHDLIEAGDSGELERLFFRYFPRSRLPGNGASFSFYPESLDGGAVEGNDLGLTFLNFSEASFNGAASVNITVSQVPEPAVLSICLGLVPLLAGRRMHV